jgi:hypothetical protein
VLGSRRRPEQPRERPSAWVSVLWTSASRTCQRLAFAVSDVERLQRRVRSTISGSSGTRT